MEVSTFTLKGATHKIHLLEQKVIALQQKNKQKNQALKICRTRIRQLTKSRENRKSKNKQKALTCKGLMVLCKSADGKSDSNCMFSNSCSM